MYVAARKPKPYQVKDGKVHLNDEDDEDDEDDFDLKRAMHRNAKRDATRPLRKLAPKDPKDRLHCFQLGCDLEHYSAEGVLACIARYGRSEKISSGLHMITQGDSHRPHSAYDSRYSAPTPYGLETVAYAEPSSAAYNYAQGAVPQETQSRSYGGYDNLTLHMEVSISLNRHTPQILDHFVEVNINPVILLHMEGSISLTVDTAPIRLLRVGVIMDPVTVLRTAAIIVLKADTVRVTAIPMQFSLVLTVNTALARAEVIVDHVTIGDPIDFFIASNDADGILGHASRPLGDNCSAD